MATVLSQQVYPASTQISSAVAFTPGSTSVVASALMADADALNGANTCIFALAASYDPQGSTFQREGYANWQGGVAAPSLSWMPGSRIPTFVRVEIDLPKALSIGVDLVVQ